MKKVFLKFTNGLSFASGLVDILSPLLGEYEFVESRDPEFVIFGPYGKDVPPPGGPTRIGYFCENLEPDMSICEWAFGNRYEEDVGDPRYIRIRWHGVSPSDLIRPDPVDADRLMGAKTGFCNFVYANRVPYRERFFRELSKYKRIDAPGRSMNNMPSIDRGSGGNMWQVKRAFLKSFKFTIAFENYSFPGYQTEKLLDPMLAGSMPIYFGNPRVGEHFNERSFVNAHRYVVGALNPMTACLERWSKISFRETLDPMNVRARARRKLKGFAQLAKMRLQTLDFGPLIEEIVRIDKDDQLYLDYVRQPWFPGNEPLSNEPVLRRWRTIFSGESSSGSPIGL